MVLAWVFSLFCRKGPPVQMSTMIKYARQASLWKREITAEGSQEHMQKARLPLLPQLLCTLGSILLTSHISIRLQHILPSPALNQNLEGSDLPAKEHFDKLVTDARQLWFRGSFCTTPLQIYVVTRESCGIYLAACGKARELRHS